MKNSPYAPVAFNGLIDLEVQLRKLARKCKNKDIRNHIISAGLGIQDAREDIKREFRLGPATTTVVLPEV